MLKINFLPDSDLDDVSQAIKEYEELWASDGERIVLAWEKITSYVFKETFINAVVWSGKGGHSHPLGLTAKRLLIEEKKNHLVHELGHRLLYVPLREIFQRTKKRVGGDKLGNHKLLNLVLYDVLELLYGKEFADYVVEQDSINLLDPVYKEAWDFALSFKTKGERQEKFKEMMK